MKKSRMKLLTVRKLAEQNPKKNRVLARALNVAPSTVQRLVACHSSISPDMAVKLAVVLGSTPEMWLRLQSSYDLEKAENRVDISKLTTVYRPEPLSH